MATTGKIGVTTENIFPVIKKFLYSDHEIFLRELGECSRCNTEDEGSGGFGRIQRRA
jgi:hypothetical protein